ncbi:MAG: dipicolinate synthase subunit B [Clostridia bacterium]
MSKIKIGYCFTGSYCTIKKSLQQLQALVNLDYDVIPIVSFNVKNTDTRFFTAKELLAQIEKITGKKPIDTIEMAEPIGPQKLLDILIIAPCTGNTISKLKNSITDTPVTMATKAHLRNEKPVVLCIATNDGLGASAQNIAILLNNKNYFFVPFGQDDYEQKPKSLIGEFCLIPQTIEYALKGEQIQPVIRCYEPKNI